MKAKPSRYKRLTALLLSLFMILSMLPLSGIQILAETGADVWDGTTASGFAGGDGSAEQPYEIATGAQLAYLSEQVNSGETYVGRHFVLTAHLNLNNRDWAPIGGSYGSFQGFFDGAGHTVSNYRTLGKQGDTVYYRQGLFGIVQDGVLKNLTVSNVKITDSANAATAHYVGGLAGMIYDNVRVENCHVRNVTITVGVYSAGGLAGSITSDATAPDPVTGGGLFGCTAQNIAIAPDGVMGKAGNYGGLVGNISSIKVGDSYTLENCSASGSITTALSTGWDGSDWGGIGGLVGFMIGGSFDSDTGDVDKNREFLIRNCHADVSVNAPNLGSVGGLFGEASILTMEDSSASGAVSGKWAVGGLLGVGTASELRGCHATGSVTASDWHVGGLVGQGQKATLDHCFATGNVTSSHSANFDSRVGGLLGNGYGGTVTDCYALGDVNGVMSVGGLVGWVTDATDSFTAGSFTNCFALGRVQALEGLEYTKPLINGIWDAGSADSAKVVNCYYNSANSGREDSQGTDKTLEEFADGTVLGLLDGAFVQIEGAASPTLPVEWNGYPKSFKPGFFYQISQGKTVRSNGREEVDHIALPVGAQLELQGVWEIGSNLEVRIQGRISCGDDGKFVMTAGKTNSRLDVYGSIDNFEALGGSAYLNKGSRIDKLTVDLPTDESIQMYGQLTNYGGAVEELVLKRGKFYNYNNAVVGRATVTDGELYNIYLRFTGWEDHPNPPVIEEVVLQGGFLYQDNTSDAAHEGPPYENPARIKKLTMDMTVPSGTVYNCLGGVIEEAILDGGDIQIDSPEDTATFDNYKGGVVEKLTVKGNAGSNIFNRNDTEYGAPIVKEVTTDGGHCKMINDNGGVIEKAEIWHHSELVNSRRAVIKTALIHESNVRNTFDQTTNTGGIIEKLYTTDRSSINNWGSAEIQELYADRPEENQLYIYGVDEEFPETPAGTIGKLHYRIHTDPNAPGAFSLGDHTKTVTEAGDVFNGIYGLADTQIDFAFDYTGSGKLTDILMNGTKLNALADGSYLFTMPQQNAVLSLTDRALSSNATLTSLTYSMDGGKPIPVPGFVAEGESYTVDLPRTTSRNASITLFGVCRDENAEITDQTDAVLTFGMSEQPASITVTAEDGKTKTYQVQFCTEPVKADMKDADIIGVENGTAFIQNEIPDFTANGSGMENSDPAIGDQRYCPANWKIDDGSVLSGIWDSAPFTGCLDLSRLTKGVHTLTIQYNLERFGELDQSGVPTGIYGWIAVQTESPENLIKTVSFTVDPVTYRLTVVNGTDQTGSGPYEKGSTVRLQADEPAPGYVFDQWVLTSGNGSLVDAGKAETTFIVEESNATVTASYQDVEPPTGEIAIAGNGWKEFLNSITFGLFYREKQDVTITAADSSGEEVTVEYFLSADALTLEDVKAKSEGWMPYNGTFGVDPDQHFILYARLTDAAGNVSYLSSDGVVLDANPPVIEGIQDGKIYAEAVNVTVSDQYLDSVSLNDAKQKTDGTTSAFALTENGSYTVIANDRAGNVTTCTVTIHIPPETYLLTFDTDGGTPVPAVQTLEAGGTPTPVSDPAKQGFKFLGWYDGERKVEFSGFKMPNKNVILKAKWEKVQANPEITPKTGDSFPASLFWITLFSFCGTSLIWVNGKKNSSIR